MKLTLVSRGGWGARPPRRAIATDADETYGHHSASNHRGAAGVRAIQNFHMDVRGWSDIAYSFVMDRFTNVVYEGRGWGVRPGSQRNYNTGTWSLCLMGDFRTAVPTRSNLATIAALIRHGENLGHIPRTLTGGHKDAPGQATTCPGINLYSEIPTIRRLLAKEDHMFIAADGRNGWPSKGPVVEYWQHFLRRLDPSYDPGVGGWGDATTPEFAAELAKFSPGDPVIGPGEKVSLEVLLAQKHAGGGDDHDHDGRYVRDITWTR